MKRIYLLLAMFSVVAFLAFSNAVKSISGMITDEAGNSVPYASVSIKGTQKSISSDGDGHYKIDATVGQILVFSAIGYHTKEVKVGQKSVINVVLVATDNRLDEVVVVGFAKQRRQTFTGAVSIIGESTPNNNKRYRYQNQPALQGRVAGVVADGKPLRGSNDRWRYNNNFNREGYDNIKENPFLKVTDNPLSTFSIDVDGASYSNIRRFINQGQLPPNGAVRIEEMINYFTYKYPQPKGDAPFSINTQYAVCPWNARHQIVSIGLQGKKIPTENLPPANLIFLIDVSGSMMSPDKLPLVQTSMKLLVDQLRPQDKVAMVVYAGSAGLVLPSTKGSEKVTIKNAIDKLQAGGSTAGGAGIQLAYKVAEDNFIKKGNNRVILCTDGDFNVGLSSDDALENMITEKRESGVYLTVLGFGIGNYQDAKMQKLADKGNGNHAYIDNLKEARKVLINQFGGTMFTIAKDVKLQIEFNPSKVQGYRLIGYENRMLAKEDFNDDKKDAGELGSGHTVTALYEIIPVGVDALELKNVDALKYQKPNTKAVGFNNSGEVMTVKFRYKKPDGNKSILLQGVVAGNPVAFKSADENIQLAAAVAQFGMLLRDSEFKGEGGYDLVNSLLKTLLDIDPEGYKNELVQLVQTASNIKKGGNNQIDDIGFYPRRSK